MANKKPTCEIANVIYCRKDKGLSRLQGTKKGDPKFWACWGCQVWLQSMKIKTKPVK